QQHLRVAAGGEPAAARLQLAAQVAEVVDLAVEDEGDGAVLASHRLLAGDEVDDRQTCHPECRLAIQIAAGVVGAAVLEDLQHRVEDLAVAAARADPAGDAAHQRVAPTGAPARLSRRSSTQPAAHALERPGGRASPIRPGKRTLAVTPSARARASSRGRRSMSPPASTSWCAARSVAGSDAHAKSRPSTFLCGMKLPTKRTYE